tara:strand:- start:740 stop:2173 length:1434 start_codon:yes stop_codon:yes gene_type:complete
MKKTKIQPIILCGGSGTRLWPLSRESFPKQFIPLLSNSERSLLQETILRISGIENIEQPIFICNEEHRFIVAEQMRLINIKPKSIILEPISRNTCPAIALATLKAYEEEEDQVLLVLSSDHLIKNKNKFLESIDRSVRVAEEGKLVTFGIVPTCPETGYGYIEAGDHLKNESFSFVIKKFIEKPKLELAKKLILEKNYTWNSGMFVFKTSTIMRELERFESSMVGFCKKSLNKGFKDLEFQRLDKESFARCNDTSIDVSIMEKTNLGVVIPLDVEWSDVGSWQSLWENEEKDNEGNVIAGKVLVKNVKNSYIKSDSRLVVCNGLDNLIVVETNDAILVSEKDASKNIKEIVKDLSDNKFLEAKKHKKIYRPWGSYTSVAEDLKWQVKRIEVKPGEQLSLQKHKYRAEHWVVVRGIAEVTLDDKKSFLKENQSVFIPLGSKHRLGNPGKLTLILIEVQSGSYLGEDDIERFQDDYGRN